MTSNLTTTRTGRFAILLLALFALSACAGAGEDGDKREDLNTYDRFIQDQLHGA